MVDCDDIGDALTVDFVEGECWVADPVGRQVQAVLVPIEWPLLRLQWHPSIGGPC